MLTLHDLEKQIAKGESETLELKRSTGQLSRAGETLCAFLNGRGGKVLFGAGDDGRISGQLVSDKMQREIAAMLDRFEPPALIKVGYVDLPNSKKKLIVLDAKLQGEARPFTFDGRAYRRVQSTTSVMPQGQYERMLLDRAHARRRWENQPAVDVHLEDLDHEEILRTREDAIRQRRIAASTGMEVGDILERLGLMRDGVITQAAQILYGTRFLPDYPQSMLKMGRFRGTKITGDILDNRQEHLHAFAAVREAIAWLDRTLPISARFPDGEILREDRIPVPPNALREIILNAVMHRDYANAGGYVAIAVFDDRIEVRSIGALPGGISAEDLARPHKSIPRNPLIAEAFHRTGGRGDLGKRYQSRHRGMRTLRYRTADIRREERRSICHISSSNRTDTVKGTKSALSRHQVQVLENTLKSLGLTDLMRICGRFDRTKFRNQVIRPLLDAGLLEMTIPDKPTSSLQQYRVTESGRGILDEKQSEEDRS